MTEKVISGLMDKNVTSDLISGLMDKNVTSDFISGLMGKNVTSEFIYGLMGKNATGDVISGIPKSPTSELTFVSIHARMTDYGPAMKAQIIDAHGFKIQGEGPRGCWNFSRGRGIISRVS